MHYLGAGLFGHIRPDGLRYFKSLCHGGKYRGVSDADSDAWIDRKWQQWRGATTGPATCQGFEARNPQGCEGCKWKGKISSPIAFAGGYGQETETVQSFVVPAEDAPDCKIKLPDKWSFHGNKLARVTEEKDENDRIKENVEVVSDFKMYLDSIHTGELDSEKTVFTFRQWLPHEGWFPVSISGYDLFNGASAAHLLDRGGQVRNASLFREFAHDAREKWINENPRTMLYEQCGWKEDDKFLIGDQLYWYRHSGTVYVETAAVSPELRTRTQWLGPKTGGDVRRWFAAYNRAWQAEDYGAHFMVFSSGGAVLMRLLNEHEGGVIVNTYDPEPGGGKTLAIKTGASLWGQWDGLKVSHNDTLAARGLTIAALSNLPVFFDEIDLMNRKDTPEVFRDFVMGFGAGSDKQRAQQSGKGLQHQAGRHQTMAPSTANRSLIDLVSTRYTDAASKRILEWRWVRPAIVHAMGDEIEFELWEHAGTAGDACMKYLLRPEVLAWAKSMVREASREYMKVLGSEDRFRAHGLACALVWGLLMKQLGLTHADPLAVVQWVFGQLQVQRAAQAPAAGAVQVLAEFLGENHANCLQVPHGFIPGQKQVTVLPGAIPRALLMRHETEPRRLYIAQREFREWVTGHGYAWGEMLSELTRKKVVVNPNKRVTLGAGTTVVSAPCACVEIDLTSRLLTGIAGDLNQERVA